VHAPADDAHSVHISSNSSTGHEPSGFAELWPSHSFAFARSGTKQINNAAIMNVFMGPLRPRCYYSQAQYLQIGLSGQSAQRRASLRAAQVPLIPRCDKAKS